MIGKHDLHRKDIQIIHNLYWACTIFIQIRYHLREYTKIEGAHKDVLYHRNYRTARWIKRTLQDFSSADLNLTTGVSVLMADEDKNKEEPLKRKGRN